VVDELLVLPSDADIVKSKPNSNPNSKAWKMYRRRPKNSMAIWF